MINFTYPQPTGVICMQTAKIFNTGRSQAVRLPKSFEFDSKEVIIKHFGNGVLLLPKKKNAWLAMQQALDEFECNFSLQREEQNEQQRDEIV